MILTFNGCYFSPIKVHPANWKQTGKNAPSLKKDWYTFYRFYDPTVRDANGKIKPLLVIGKGMNMFKTISDRRTRTQMLIDEETKDLTIRGYNPITMQYMAEAIDDFAGDIPPDTPFIDALRAALPKLSIGHRTRIGIRSVIKGVEKAAVQLRFHEMPISNIGRRHIKKILERCQAISPNWSNQRFNAYRAYLLMLYNELVEQEAVAGNPVRDITKKPVTQKIKAVLTADERTAVDSHLSAVFPKFHAFVHLFFHSGGRKTELFQLKPPMIDLERQVYRCVIKKRKKHTEVERTIKDIAVPFWELFLKDCPQDAYVFGTRFEPGEKAMGVDMPSRYWERYVKAPSADGGLGIQKDLYSLKHANSTEIVTMLDEQAAAAMNAHTSTAMVRSIYDVKQAERQHERLKGLRNKFA